MVLQSLDGLRPVDLRLLHDELDIVLAHICKKRTVVQIQKQLVFMFMFREDAENRGYAVNCCESGEVNECRLRLLEDFLWKLSS